MIYPHVPIHMHSTIICSKVEINWLVIDHFIYKRYRMAYREG